MAYEHAGHRQRMLQKMKCGCLLEYELLEVMLYPLIPRRNTCDLAHRLLRAFGSISGVYSAAVEELQKVSGIGERTAQSLYELGSAYREYVAKRRREAKPFTAIDFTAYVQRQYVGMEYEVLDVYLLTREEFPTNKLRYTDFKRNEVTLPVEELNRLLLTEKPQGIVIVHNHPIGGCQPSKDDERVTKCVQLICNMYGVILCDHIIYSQNGVYSYYLSGRLSGISKKYSMDAVTER